MLHDELFFVRNQNEAMKKFAPIFILLFTFSCSRFSEDIQLSELPDSIAALETDLPIVNIRVDQNDFDEMYKNFEEEIEIDADFDLYRNHELVVEGEEVELEIKGNYSTRFTLKSIGVKFDDKYDNSDRSLINPEEVLPFHSIDKIKAIRLRNAGNDFPNTMIKDMSFTQLAIRAGLDIDLTYGEPALVYINEVFYGLMNIRTEANTNGMAGLYRADKDDITLAKVTTRELFYKDGDEKRLEAFVEAIEQQDAEYLKDEIDINNFIDYMVFESYLANTDWPHNNCRFYAIGDSKFRFVLFDLDNVATLKMNKSPLTIIEDKSRSNIITDLFFTLYSDESFQELFWNRFNYLVESGLISYKHFVPIVEENVKRINTEIRYQITEHNAPRTVVEWGVEIDKMLVLFEEREYVVRNFLEEQ